MISWMLNSWAFCWSELIIRRTHSIIWYSISKIREILNLIWSYSSVCWIKNLRASVLVSSTNNFYCNNLFFIIWWLSFWRAYLSENTVFFFDRWTNKRSIFFVLLSILTCILILIFLIILIWSNLCIWRFIVLLCFCRTKTWLPYFFRLIVFKLHIVIIII